MSGHIQNSVEFEQESSHPGVVSAILLPGSKDIDKRANRRQNPRFRVGGIPKRSTGSDCKSDGFAFEGSNPSPSTKNTAVRNVFLMLRVGGLAGVAQW